MIRVNCIGYLLTFVVYFIWGDSSVFWGGFNICTQLYFYSLSLYMILRNIKPDTLDVILIKNTIVITVFRAFYTHLCIYSTNVELVNIATQYFTCIVSSYVVILFLYLIYLHNQLCFFKKLIQCLIKRE